MSNVKKITAAVTAISLFLVNFSAFAWDENRGDAGDFIDETVIDSIYRFDVGDFVKNTSEIDSYSVSDEVELICALGIMKMKEGNDFADDEKLSYADFYRGISMLYMGRAKDDMTLKDRDITVRDALAAVISALGYDYMLTDDASDGWILDNANELKLLKNISLGLDKFITRKEFAVLLYNALDCPVVQRTISGTEIKYEVDENFTALNRNFDIYKIEGVLNAVGNLNLFGGAKPHKGYIQIEGISINTDDTQKAKTLFAQKVTAYAHLSDDEYTLLLLKKAADTITINFSDIEDVQGNKLTYTADGKAQNIKLSNERYMLYNGDSITDWSFLKERGDKHGTVTISQAAKKQKYDTVVIKQYNDYMISTAFEEDKTISLNYGAEFNGDSVIYLDDDDIDLTLMLDNKPTEISELESNMAISVMANRDCDYVEILASSKKINGRVSSIDEDNKATVEDKEYIISTDYIEASKRQPDRAKKISVGVQGIFYLTADGYIAGFKQKSSNETYAVLIKAYEDDIENEPVIKLYDEYGEFKTLKLADKVTLDNVSYNSSDAELMSILKKYLNQEYKIQYDYDNDGKFEDDLLSVLPLISYRATTAGIKVINTAMGKNIECNGMYKGNNNDWMGALSFVSEDKGSPQELKHRADATSTVFIIPEDRSKESEYKITDGTSSLFKTDTGMGCQYFNENEFYLAQYMVCESKKVSVDTSAGDTQGIMMYIKSINQTYDEDEVKNVINGYTISTDQVKEASYIVSDELYEAVGFKKDCIYNIMVRNSEPYSASLFFDVNDTALKYERYHGSTRNWNAKIVARVLAIDPANGWILFDYGGSSDRSAYIKYAPVTLKNKKIKQVDKGTIKVGDKVFMEYARGNVNFIYIIPGE